MKSMDDNADDYIKLVERRQQDTRSLKSKIWVWLLDNIVGVFFIVMITCVWLFVEVVWFVWSYTIRRD